MALPWGPQKATGRECSWNQAAQLKASITITITICAHLGKLFLFFLSLSFLICEARTVGYPLQKIVMRVK